MQTTPPKGDVCLIRNRLHCAFTLIELMVAVAIMAVIMTVAIPNLYRGMQQNSMRKAVNDVMEACTTARARAILENTTMELRIRPADGTFSVGAATAPKPEGIEGLQQRTDYKWGERMAPHSEAAPAKSGAFSAKLPPNIIVKGLGVNGEDWTEDAEARVRFLANGTSDEMSIVLLADTGELRNIWLEAVTGLPEVEVDLFKFRDR